MTGVERTGAGFLEEWAAPPGPPVSGIRFRVYGARVEHTMTTDQKAVHVVFHPVLRDPNASPCACGACRAQDLAIAALGRMW